MPEHHARERATGRPRKTSAPVDRRSWARHAHLLPFGPAFLSAGWRDETPDVPPPVVVVVTRKGPGQWLVPALALVDRTCLGVKSALEPGRMRGAELLALLESVPLLGEVGFEPCPVALAQSIVFAAVDYARTLGFEPSALFREELFGPRPTTLIDTPLGRRARPLYVRGPYDDAPAVRRQLDCAVGPGGWDFVEASEEDRLPGLEVAEPHGSVDDLAEFARPIIDGMHASSAVELEQALTVGAFMWQLAVCDDETDRRRMLEAFAAEACRDDDDRRDLYDLAEMMLERHREMFPSMHD
jgi:hypothetical protein